MMWQEVNEILACSRASTWRKKDAAVPMTISLYAALSSDDQLQKE